MKTIRQIADEIGVSKQTVYKRYKGKLHTVCAPYAHTEQGVLYIEEQGETLIKQDFLQKECSVGAHTYAHTERSNGEVLEQSENVGVIAVLQTTIDTLQGQLAIKDKQIEDLDLSVRSYNCLKRAGIHSVRQLVEFSENDLLNIRNFGAKSIEEVKDKLISMGLNLKQ